MKTASALTAYSRKYIDQAIASWPVAIICAALLWLAPVLVFLVGAPYAGEWASRNLPVAYEQKLGRYMLDSNALNMEKSKLQPESQVLYRQRVLKLAALAGLSDVQVEFRAGWPNAFALPGNIVVLTDDLISQLDDPELVDAIIAHELGHLHERHLIKKIFSATILSELILRSNGQDHTSGKVGGALAALGIAPFYSRQHETQADTYALALLQKNGQSPLLFAKAIREVGSFYQRKRITTAGYTSSHPDAESRAMLAVQAAAAR